MYRFVSNIFKTFYKKKKKQNIFLSESNVVLVCICKDMFAGR